MATEARRHVENMHDVARNASARSKFAGRSHLADGSSVDDLYRAVMREHGLDQLDQRGPMRDANHRRENRRVVPLRASVEGQRTESLQAETRSAGGPPKVVKRGLWRQTVDPASGKVYYYHKLTKVTCWNPPPSWDNLAGADAAKVEETAPLRAESEGDSREAKAAALREEDQSHPERKEPARQASNERTESQAAAAAAPSVARDIRRVVDAQSGRAYFYDRVTRQSFWDDPRLSDPELDRVESNIDAHNVRNHVNKVEGHMPQPSSNNQHAGASNHFSQTAANHRQHYNQSTTTQTQRSDAEGNGSANVEPDVSKQIDGVGGLGGDFEDDSWMKRSHGRASLRASRRQEAEQVLRNSRRMSVHKESWGESDDDGDISPAPTNNNGQHREQQHQQHSDNYSAYDDEDDIEEEQFSFSKTHSHVGNGDVSLGNNSSMPRNAGAMSFHELEGQPQPQPSAATTAEDMAIDAHIDAELLRVSRRLRSSQGSRMGLSARRSVEGTVVNSMRSSQHDRYQGYDDVDGVASHAMNGVESKANVPQRHESKVSGHPLSTRGGFLNMQEPASNTSDERFSGRTDGGDVFERDTQNSLGLHAGADRWEDDQTMSAIEEAFRQHRQTEMRDARGMITTDVQVTTSLAEADRRNGARDRSVELGEAVTTEGTAPTRQPVPKSSLRLLKKKIRRVKSSSGTPTGSARSIDRQHKHSDDTNELHRARSEGHQHCAVSGGGSHQRAGNGVGERETHANQAWVADDHALRSGVGSIDVPVVNSRGAPIACERRTGCPCVDCTQSSAVVGGSHGAGSSFKPTTQVSAMLAGEDGISSAVAQDDLEPCELCGRRFNARARVVHQRVCGKVFRGKRTTATNASQTRLAALAERNRRQRSKGSRNNPRTFHKASNWRDQSAQVREAMRSIKGPVSSTPPRPASRGRPPRGVGSGGVGGGGTLKSRNRSVERGVERAVGRQQGAKPLNKENDTRFNSSPSHGRPSTPTPAGYVQCPHCGRSFSSKAGERHIPMCQTIKAKPTTLHRGKGRGAHLGRQNNLNGLAQTTGTAGTAGGGALGNSARFANGHSDMNTAAVGHSLPPRARTPTLKQGHGVGSRRHTLTPTARASTARLSRGTLSGDDMGYNSDNSYSSPNNHANGSGSRRVSVTRSGVQLTPCPTCSRQFSRKAFDRHVTYCAKLADEKNERAARAASLNSTTRPASSGGMNGTGRQGGRRTKSSRGGRVGGNRLGFTQERQSRSPIANSSTLEVISDPNDLYDALLVQRSKKGHVVVPSPELEARGSQQRHSSTRRRRAGTTGSSQLAGGGVMDEPHWPQVGTNEDVGYDDDEYDDEHYRDGSVRGGGGRFATMNGGGDDDVVDSRAHRRDAWELGGEHESNDQYPAHKRDAYVNQLRDPSRGSNISYSSRSGAAHHVTQSQEYDVNGRGNTVDVGRGYDGHRHRSSSVENRHGMSEQLPEPDEATDGVYDTRRSWMYEAAAGTKRDAPVTSTYRYTAAAAVASADHGDEMYDDYGGNEWTEGGRRTAVGSRGNNHEYWDADAFE